MCQTQHGLQITTSLFLMFNCIHCRDIDDMMLIRHLFGIVVLLILFEIVTLVKAGSCFVTDTTWAADNQGFVNVTSKVVLYFQPIALQNQRDNQILQEECQRLCKASSSCQGFTHFNGSASPYTNFCETFPTILSSIPCSNCVSGPSSCICSGSPQFRRKHRIKQAPKLH